MLVYVRDSIHLNNPGFNLSHVFGVEVDERAGHMGL
jgi:hypothetical protein